MLEEIQERLDNAERTRLHLDSIESRAQDELRALELTAKIEQAKTELATLRASDSAGQAGGIADRERVQELVSFIEDASIRAGEAITGGVDEAGLTRQMPLSPWRPKSPEAWKPEMRTLTGWRRVGEPRGRVE